MLKQLIAFLVAALAAPALAAVPTVSVVSQTINETAGTATVRIIRTGDLSKPSQIGFKTINGTALAGVNFTYRSGGVWFPALTNSYRFTVSILVDHKVTPDLNFTVRLSAVLNAQLVNGTITIHNTDQPPPPPPSDTTPHPCLDFSGTTPLGPVEGSNCPARMCPGSPNPVDWSQLCPTPPPPPPALVAAPLTNGGYARCKTVGGCHRFGPGSSPVIAAQGDVRQQAWNGVSACMAAENSCRIIAALWPVGHDPMITMLASDWTLGVEGWQDEWEGVAPGP